MSGKDHTSSVENLHHHHDFETENPTGERRTLYVLILTAVTMVVEIIAGKIYGSMALLADGWHMGTHVAAFMITLFAYRYARKHANDPTYSFGTGKVNVLGGFASAVALAMVALMMLIESVQRFFGPLSIQFDQAILVATIGLVVNLVSAVLLKDQHGHEHHHDHNLKAAYMHVLADALTSLLAIVALLCGKYFGWQWLDPTMGIVGSIIIIRWAYNLVTISGPILLDVSIAENYQQAIKDQLESSGDTLITDIHIWKVAANNYAAIISLVSDSNKLIADYKASLSGFKQISHLTIELNQCDDLPKARLEFEQKSSN